MYLHNIRNLYMFLEVYQPKLQKILRKIVQTRDRVVESGANNAFSQLHIEALNYRERLWEDERKANECALAKITGRGSQEGRVIRAQPLQPMVPPREVLSEVDTLPPAD